MTNQKNQQFIFGCIFLLANKLQLLGDKVTAELTLKQWFLLNILLTKEKNPPNINEVAKVLGTSRQNVSKMASALESKGMVKLQPSQSDKRSVDIVLTEKSFDYFAAKEEAGNVLLDTLFREIPSAQIESGVEFLGHLLQNVEKALVEAKV